MKIKLGTFCSGIGSPELAATTLGWKCAWASEIDPFASAVHAHRFPNTPNLGDMTKLHGGDLEPVDVIFAGTPCQSFSVAGLRAGMADPRGNLALVLLGLVDAARPGWLVWENVPGVLSSNGGKDFGAFLGALAELGYGFAYRVLDAQYVRTHGHERAVPQRRRRVFVVGHSDWRRAAAVLFERESMCGNHPPSREAGEGVARETANSLRSGGAVTSRVGDTRGQDNVVADVAPTLDASYAKKWGLDNQHVDAGCPLFITSGQSNAAIANDVELALNSTNEQSFIAFSTKDHGADACEGVSPTIRSGGFKSSHANGGVMPAVAIQGSMIGRSDKAGPNGPGFDVTGSSFYLTKSDRHGVASRSGVRRLLPIECEMLQGFPPNWTNITYRNKPAADAPRYRAIGNSIAVNCSRWILERIQMVEAIKERAA